MQLQILCCTTAKIVVKLCKRKHFQTNIAVKENTNVYFSKKKNEKKDHQYFPLAIY